MTQNQPPLKKQKLTTNDRMLIESVVLQHEVFSYAPPKDYLPLLLTCHEYCDLLKMNSSFLYYRMLKTFTFDRLPPLHFFASRTAVNIRTIVPRYMWKISDNKFERYNAFITCVSLMEEAYGMELLKLYPFVVTLEHTDEVKPWFSNLMKELTTITQCQPDDQHRIRLIEKYLMLRACYDLDTCLNACYGLVLSGLQRLCLQSANYGVKKNVLMVVLSARSTAPNLSYVSEDYLGRSIRNDKDIVLAAISRNDQEFQFASRELKRDPDVILAAAKDSYNPLLSWLDTDLRDSKELMLKVLRLLQQKGISSNYDYLPDRLKLDRDIRLELVAKEVYYYEYMPNEMKKDEEFVRQCIVRNPVVMEYVKNENITNDKEFVLANPDTFPFAFMLRRDREVVMQLVDKCGWKFVAPHMIGEMQSDIKLWRTILSVDGCLLEYAAPNIKSNIELVRHAVSNNPQSIRYIGGDLFANKIFACEMLDIIEKYSGRKLEMVLAVCTHYISDQGVLKRAIQIEPMAERRLQKYLNK
jgi:hypothetical protein